VPPTIRKTKPRIAPIPRPSISPLRNWACRSVRHTTRPVAARMPSTKTETHAPMAAGLCESTPAARTTMSAPTAHQYQTGIVARSMTWRWRC
jgi:hypothetical protein